MTVNKYINKTEIEQNGMVKQNGIWRYKHIYAHESRDTIKRLSFDKVDVKAMQFPIQMSTLIFNTRYRKY